MGQQFSDISAKNQAFIEAQKVFFVGTATTHSRVNISPKGMDSLKVLGPNRVVWLNLTGSGNETAAHVQQQPRMTLMFTAFDGNPNIVRLYGTARDIHQNHSEWAELYALFNPLPGARQIFDLKVELVQNSCGMAVPLYTYQKQRSQLTDWAVKQGAEGLTRYWKKKNQLSLDGIASHILTKNT